MGNTVHGKTHGKPYNTRKTHLAHGKTHLAHGKTQLAHGKTQSTMKNTGWIAKHGKTSSTIFFQCVFLPNTERVHTPFSNSFLLLTHMCACVCILVCVWVDLYIQTYGGATIRSPNWRQLAVCVNGVCVCTCVHTCVCVRVCACVCVCVCDCVNGKKLLQKENRASRHKRTQWY